MISKKRKMEMNTFIIVYMGRKKMIELLLFEGKKIVKSKKSIVMITLFFLLIIVVTFANMSSNNNFERNQIPRLTSNITSIHNAMNQLPKDDKIPKVKKIRENYLWRIENTEKIIEAHKTGNWKKGLEYQISLDQNTINLLRSGTIVGGEPTAMINSRLLFNQELLDRGIEPINERFPTKGFNLMKSILNIFLGFSGTILFTLLIGDILATEFEKGTIKILFTQRIKRQKVMSAKLIIALFGSLLLIVVLGLIAFLIGSLISGTGSGEYPVLIHSGGNEIVFIDLFSFILQSFILYAFVLLLVISILFLLSILSNSVILTASIAIILFSVSHLGITNYGYLKSIAHLLPFTYFDTFKIIDGSLAESLQNVNISMQTGLVVLSLSIILTLTVSAILIKRKDIL
jgi:ABC-2 type transport system permease protein